MNRVDSFECDQCGACCVPFHVPVSEEDMRTEPRIAAVVQGRIPLPMRGTGGAYHYLANGTTEPCPFHENGGRCAIQETKPHACRIFEPGEYLCQWARGKAGLGPLHPMGSFSMFV